MRLWYGGVLANRKPVFVFRSLFLFRVPERTFQGLSFHDPPRMTRSRGQSPPRKIPRRKRQEWACSACAIQARMRMLIVSKLIHY